MKHLKKYKTFLEDGTANATAATAGMGAVSSAQPGGLPGTTGTSGSGDISFYMLDKKGKKIKKGNPSQVSDMRFLSPAKGITKVKESAKTEEYSVVEECLIDLIDMGFEVDKINLDSQYEEYEEVVICLDKKNVEKVWRDKSMEELDNLFLTYQFDRNGVCRKTISTDRPGNRIEDYESEIADISEEISHKLINHLEYTYGCLQVDFIGYGSLRPRDTNSGIVWYRNIEINIRITLRRNVYPTNEFYLLDKKGNKIEKGKPNEVFDMRFLAPAKGITKVKESVKTEEYFVVEECLTELIDMGFEVDKINFDNEDEEYDINDDEVGKFKSQEIRISLFKQVEKVWRGNIQMRYLFDRNEVYKKTVSTFRPGGDKLENDEAEIVDISEEISHKLINHLEYTSGTLTIYFQVVGSAMPFNEPRNMNINIHIVLNRNVYSTNESYSDVNEYIEEIKTMLKAYNIRPVVLNQIIDGYSDVIEQYYQEGKYPKLFVDEIIKDFELDSGGFLSYKVGSPSYNQTIKYL